MVLSAAASAVATFSAGGYFTVAEGILFPTMVDLFVTACEPLGIDRPLRRPAGARSPWCCSRVQSRTSEPEHRGALADEPWSMTSGPTFERARCRRRATACDAGDRAPDVIADESYRRWETGRVSRLLAD